jgi:integrase/recombinase XerD
MRLRRRKRTVQEQPVVYDRMHALLEQYLVWMQMQNFSEDTVATRRTTIDYFLAWARERGLDAPAEITRPVLERYQRSLYQYRKKNGDPLTFRTQNTRLRSLKGWFRWMARQNHILHNPASELLLPRLENRLPKYILNVDEAETVLAVPDVSTVEGLRDRAILETFYSTGMRRMEVTNLKLYDIDRERGTVMIRLGKGKKDRHIPIGERALAWIGKYIAEARPELLGAADDGTVFLDELGAAFNRVRLTTLVRGYIRKAKIGKQGGCHLFRHTVATMMLENGADIRVIQEMLGHAKISTTEMYTRVSINLLRQVYAATHPGANLNRPHITAKAADTAATAELFAALADEASEENL